MEIKLAQEDMIEMAGHFLSYHEYMSMTDFERYCHSRDLIKEWNCLPLEQRTQKSFDIELLGFEVESPVWV